MSTIVLHKPTDKKFILIGACYEIPAYARQLEPLYGSLPLGRSNCAVEMAAVCDSEGHISYMASEEFIVLEIDGVSPSQII